MSSFSVRSRIHNPWRTMLSLEGETISVRRQGATPTLTKPHQRVAHFLLEAASCRSGFSASDSEGCRAFLCFPKGETASSSNFGALQMWQQVVVCAIWAHFETSM